MTLEKELLELKQQHDREVLLLFNEYKNNNITKESLNIALKLHDTLFKEKEFNIKNKFK